MDAYLVCPSCFQIALHQGRRLFISFNGFVMGCCCFSAILYNGHFFTVIRASGDIARDCSLFGRGNTVNDSIISPLNGMVKNCSAKPRWAMSFLPQPECRSCFCQYDGQFRVLLRRRFRIENPGNDTKGH